ncbi:hypothetical protein C1H46_041163 [Malus baccata]|uniref:Uncharacterized protein n=1 Tax=Malus baccata TaxID=106549 RepID=A0A540KGF1_MALBA|nr:hypothetical protein C1H46_041163 [Malus baccata]
MQAKEARRMIWNYSLKDSFMEPSNTLWSQMQTTTSSNASTMKGRTPVHHFPCIQASELNRTIAAVAASTFM